PSLFYHELLAKRHEIEQQVGSSLLWESQNRTGKYASIQITSAGNYNDREAWPAQHGWMDKHLRLFMRIFSSKPASIILDKTPLHVADPVQFTDMEISARLAAKVGELDIQPYQGVTDWLPWRSGVFALVDCIFSARARYERVVLPMLKERLARRLPDDPTLRFSDFVADIDSFKEDKFDRYATSVLNRQKLAGRLKVEVAYEAARFFAKRGSETMYSLQSKGPKLEEMILGELRSHVRGIGPALGNYLMILLGDESRVKLDGRLVTFLTRELGWSLNPMIPADYERTTEVFRVSADMLSTTAARLENAIWRYEESK
ncbi:MAG TPA: DUF4268 domain-containing protein, partial [Chthonomonadaceae bacterium]|nr:DUF4268 domain-containing protein [Chthonomonadaceae bacterium]